MSRVLLVGLFAVTLPSLVFLGGVRTMHRLSGWTRPAGSERPLAQRLLGYRREEMEAYWTNLGKAGRQAERRFLELDLLFPFAYGGAILAASLVVWSRLGRPFSVGWLVAGVALTAIADWTENLVQLRELKRFMTSGSSGLEPSWIRIASAATMTKLLAFSASALGLLALVVAYVRRAVG